MMQNLIMDRPYVVIAYLYKCFDSTTCFCTTGDVFNAGMKVRNSCKLVSESGEVGVLGWKRHVRKDSVCPDLTVNAPYIPSDARLVELGSPVREGALSPSQAPTKWKSKPPLRSQTCTMCSPWKLIQLPHGNARLTTSPVNPAHSIVRPQGLRLNRDCCKFWTDQEDAVLLANSAGRAHKRPRIPINDKNFNYTGGFHYILLCFTLNCDEKSS